MPMFEHRSAPVLPRARFLRRMLRSSAIAAALILLALALGIAGYRVLGGLGWVDALLNASMILGGMGPVDPITTTGGKLFASFYALFSGIAFLSIAGVLIAPIYHRFLHRFHFDLDEDEDRDADAAATPRGAEGPAAPTGALRPDRRQDWTHRAPAAGGRAAGTANGEHAGRECRAWPRSPRPTTQPGPGYNGRSMNAKWCESPFLYRRRPTREVRVGDVGIGGGNPIRVQSMTTPATTDIAATVDQIERLVGAGCEIVRVTVPTSGDARALPGIREALAARRIRVPLVADIHFSPGAALKAVEHVEKIRVNPGNYADRKQFEVREYSDAEYELELERLAETFRPLVARAKALGVAMRIGTNHGSLSDRIMNRYGDSPLGMVESALEFVRICESEGYRDLVISMKSSNPVVTIEAYRLLAARMADEGMDYPFHLGVTEAGDGEDGRIKSAVGIGSLLDDGIGDTVRVSLTEDPVEEIPVAQRLVEPYNRRLRAAG